QSEAHAIMLMIVELMRGHSESAVKSERVGAAWGEKKKDARANGSVQTTRTPAWLTVVGRRKEGKHMVGGRFQLLRDRAKVVKKMYDLARDAHDGHGLSRIVKWLDQHVAPWGGGGHGRRTPRP